MIKWLFGSDDDEKVHEKDREVVRAARYNKDAQRDHKEALDLIRLLDVEHKKNHYAAIVESALGARRKDRGEE